MRMPGKKNIWMEGDWMVDLSCLQVRHNMGMLVAFQYQPDGSYQGRVVDGYPQFDADPEKAIAQVRRLKMMLDEAGVTLEKALSANLH